MSAIFQRFTQSPDRWSEFLSLAAFVGVPEAIGQVIGLSTVPKVVPKNAWYKTLRKPSWTPPSFLFGLVWPIMYFFMGLAGWLVWTHGGWAQQKVPLTLYGVQSLLNFMWNPLFFNLERPDLALIDIIGLLISLTATIASFYSIERLAGLVLLPYLAWVSFAALLNYSILKLNPGLRSKAKTHAPAAKAQ